MLCSLRPLFDCQVKKVENIQKRSFLGGELRMYEGAAKERQGNDTRLHIHTFTRKKQTGHARSFGMCSAQCGAYCERFLESLHAWKEEAAKMLYSQKKPKHASEPTSGDCLHTGIRCAPFRRRRTEKRRSAAMSRFCGTGALGWHRQDHKALVAFKAEWS